MTTSNSNTEILALYETEPIGVSGEHEAVNVFYFCEEACRELFIKLRNPDDKPLKSGTSTDWEEGTACDQCDRLAEKDFHLNLPVCCAAAIRADANASEGKVVECLRCQRGMVYHLTTGWTRYWKPCDLCAKATSFERNNEAEPPEASFCQNCGNWTCPDCEERDEDNRMICRRCKNASKVDFDFSCRVCGVICDGAPDPPARAVCPAHCEDHNYEYDPHRRGKFCSHCDQQEDYYDE